MSASQPPTQDHILSLVQHALDDFEDVALAASVRRAWRIARLLGDSDAAWRFGHESEPLGGDPIAKIRFAGDLWPDDDDASIRERHGRLLEALLEDRRPTTAKGLEEVFTPDTVLAGSVAEIEQWAADIAQSPADPELSARTETVARMNVDRQILERIRHRTFQFLLRAERQLLFGAAAQNIFDSHRYRVDRLLAAAAPEVLDQFTAAYRRAREGDVESRSHSLTSCRRILRAVADQVYPPRDEPAVDEAGNKHELGADHYVNRLWQFMAENAQRMTAAGVSHAAIDDFGTRIDRLNDLLSKGVHDKVDQEEVDLCVIHTYLFAGEVLRIANV